MRRRHTQVKLVHRLKLDCIGFESSRFDRLPPAGFPLESSHIQNLQVLLFIQTIQGGHQFWALTPAGEVRRGEACLDHAGDPGPPVLLPILRLMCFIILQAQFTSS